MIDLRPVRKSDILFIKTYNGLVPFVVTRTSPKEGYIYASADMGSGSFLNIKVFYASAKVYLIEGDRTLNYYDLWAYAKVRYNTNETEGVVTIKGLPYYVTQTIHNGKLFCYILGMKYSAPPVVVFDLPEKGSAYTSEVRLPDVGAVNVVYMGSRKGFKLVHNR